MLEHLAKRLKIPADKFMIALADYGNTSSASIPLTITTRGIARGLKSPACDCCWRASEWASHGPAVLNFGPAICPELVEYGDQERMETPS
jgi:3-oxoacyl-[acyl-carrier-protein] synthase-3